MDSCSKMVSSPMVAAAEVQPYASTSTLLLGRMSLRTTAHVSRVTCHVSHVTCSAHLALSPILAAMSRRLAGVTSSSMATLEKWQPAPSGSSTVHSSCSALDFVNNYLTLNGSRY